MPVITDRHEWYAMLTTGGTRNVPSRCCGRITFYERPGDEWCNEHRCTVTTTLLGTRCSRKASIADECSQHFSQHLKRMLAGLFLYPGQVMTFTSIVLGVVWLDVHGIQQRR